MSTRSTSSNQPVTIKSRGTRASAAYEKLRIDIAHGTLAPGSKLRVEAMCLRYGVGASPMREALNRLSAEGMVSRTDLRGFSVAELELAELPILTRTRIQIESLALRESIEHRNAQMEDELAILIHRLSRTPRSLSADRYVTNPEWEQMHREFHQALFSRCQSRWLKAFCLSLAEESYRFRQIAAGQNFTFRDEHAEHLAIFNATIEGRADDAVNALSEHYRRTSVGLSGS